MTLFQAIAAPGPAAGVLVAKEIPSQGLGSSSKDVQLSQDDKNPPQGQLTGTSGTPVAPQVGQRGRRFINFAFISDFISRLVPSGDG